MYVRLSKPGYEYRKFDIDFKAGEVYQVTSQQGVQLLESNLFREVSLEEFGAGLSVSSQVKSEDEVLKLDDAQDVGENATVSGLAEFGIAEVVTPPKTPKNYIGDDDLSNKVVLLRRNGAFGDCVFVANMAAYLKLRFPTCTIHMAIREPFVPLFSHMDHVDECFEYSEGLLHARIMTADYVIDFGGVIENQESDCTNYAKLHFAQAQMEREANSFGRWPVITMSSLAADEHAGTAVEWLMDNNLTEDPYVVLCVGTSTPLKMLSERQLARLVGKLTSAEGSAYRMKVVLMGAEDERGHTENLVDNTWVFASMGHDLRHAATIVSKARMVIAPDTGMLHYAQATGIPTVSYWGPTDHDNTFLNMAVYEQGDSTAVYHIAVNSETSCAPCRHVRAKYCDDFDGVNSLCMVQYDVGKIADAVYTLMEDIVKHKKVVAQSAVLSPAHARNIFDPSYFNIVFTMDYTAQYNGGGYHVVQFARALASKPTIRVWLLINSSTFPYLADFNDKDVFVVNDPDLSLVCGDAELPFRLAVACPPTRGHYAVDHAQRHRDIGAQSAALVYETPNYIGKYRSGADTEEEYWKEYKEALGNVDIILPISQTVKEHLLLWEPSLADKHVEVVTPCFASDVADTVFGDQEIGLRATAEGRANSIVMIGRNMPYKCLHSAMEVICKWAAAKFGTADPFCLYIIGAATNRLQASIDLDWARAGVEVVTLEACTEKRKFELLRQAKAYVHPSEFEGFGIPLAEAMYSGTPVIASKLPVFEEAYGQNPYYYTDDEKLLSTLDSIWSAFAAPPNHPKQAYNHIVRYSSAAWDHVNKRYTLPRQIGRITTLLSGALKATDLAAKQQRIDLQNVGRKPRVAFVTTWGTRCGIAETTKDLASKLQTEYKVFAPQEPDGSLLSSEGEEQYIVRCWDKRFMNYGELVNSIVEYGANIVHIQHEFSFFKDEGKFFAFVKRLKELGLKVVVTLHTSLKSSFLQELYPLVDRIVNTKTSHETTHNTVPIDLPVPMIARVSSAAARIDLDLPDGISIVGAFGLWEKHKGYAGFLRTYHDVKARIPEEQMRGLMYTVTGHAHWKHPYLRECEREFMKHIQEGWMRFDKDYLPIADVAKRLAACDVLVCNYDIEGHSSASAAVRTMMAARKPVIVTDCSMFSELPDDVVYRIPFVHNRPDVSPELISAILALLSDEQLRNKYADAAYNWALARSTERCAEKHDALYTGLMI